MTCPHLAYRTEDDEHTFDTERAFCTVVGEFVQPMRADICNDRYELDHTTDCEIYREHANDGGVDGTARGDA
jgi:hypothetical protein